MALGELRWLCGWPAPEDPDGSRDEELAGRELIAERLTDEVQWLRDCAGWLEQLGRGEFYDHHLTPGRRTARHAEPWPLVHSSTQKRAA